MWHSYHKAKYNGLPICKFSSFIEIDTVSSENKITTFSLYFASFTQRT